MSPPNQQVVFAPTGTKIRAEFDTEVVAESRNAMLLRESPFRLVYGFPKVEVTSSALQARSETDHAGGLGAVRYWDLITDGTRREQALYEYLDTREGVPDLRGYLFVEWASANRWFEEEEQLIGHPRDPFTRIDVRQTAYHIQVELEGVTVADTSRPLVLAETGVPIRYYVPSDDITWYYLIDSETTSSCAYKGRARYWHLQVNGTVHEDLVWAYLEPLQDATLVKDALCFYQEKLTLRIDGEVEARAPRSFTK
jgi:uncharacterized protein (DUF427 family)